MEYKIQKLHDQVNQAIGNGKLSLFLSVMRQICCLIPIFWLLSLIDLRFTWFAFPISEMLVGVTGMVLYYREINRDFGKQAPSEAS